MKVMGIVGEAPLFQQAFSDEAGLLIKDESDGLECLLTSSSASASFLRKSGGTLDAGLALNDGHENEFWNHLKGSFSAASWL